MSETPKRIVGALASLALVSGTAALAVIPVIQASSTDMANGAETTISHAGESASALVKVSNVEGNFSYNQNALTPVNAISNVFNKAAASLCQSLPQYTTQTSDAAYTVNGSTDTEFAVSTESNEDAASKFVMACVCATNIAGGGAVANAEVEGIPIATIAAATK